MGDLQLLVSFCLRLYDRVGVLTSMVIAGVEHLLRDVKDATVSTLSTEVRPWGFLDQYPGMMSQHSNQANPELRAFASICSQAMPLRYVVKGAECVGAHS